MNTELTSVTVRYGSVTAVRDVSLSFASGEIHAVVGENGAGKSTLVNALFGLVTPQTGVLRIDGREQKWAAPAEAIRRGFGMVHQHFMLQDDMSVLENVLLCDEPIGRFGFVDFEAAREKLIVQAGQYGISLDLDAKISSLSVGERQVVEILKVLFRNAQALILDEPTSVLTPMEKDELFEILRSFRSSGKAIVLITHKLDEVMEIADRVSVMRGGHLIFSKALSDTDKNEIARGIVGGELPLKLEKERQEPGEVLLSADNIILRGQKTEKPVSFTVSRGEVVGIAGVSGNGQAELVQVLTGLSQAPSGAIRICGTAADNLDVTGRRKAGLSYIPEDRQRVGLALEATVTENANAGRERNAFARGPFLNLVAMAAFARELVERYNVRVRDVSSRASTMSGGNKQKLVVARELARSTPVVIAENPTWGVDVGAIDFIHRKLAAMRDAGHAILLVSTELDEIIALSDRVIVMFEGRIAGEVSGSQMTREKIGRLMTSEAEENA